MAEAETGLQEVLAQTTEGLENTLAGLKKHPTVEETGTVTYVARGIARVAGLPGVQADELILFRGGLLGLALNLDPDEVGVALLGPGEGLQAGEEARRTGRLLDVPVGETLLGRVIDPNGVPQDGRGPLHLLDRRRVERTAPAILKRKPVETPLQTGLKVVDALIPVGRGQRELILGDRQTGKTAIAIDAIINQKNYRVLCVYCAIGQQSAAVARVLAELQERGALDYTVMVVTTGDDAPGLQYVAPYAATSIAEYLMGEGYDVLIVYDDLTRHARAYRELSLLLRRPPGREAYPGDIFYLHSRLLERCTNLSQGGSLTAFPVIETQEGNLSAYIATNLISITDGQIYLSPALKQRGILPAVDVGRSVSRVGGKAQLPAYRAVAGPLRLSYSQFEELEAFARFGTRLDDDTRRTLERGRRVREVLKQNQYTPLRPAEQLVVLLATSEGLFDELPLDKIARASELVTRAAFEEAPEVCAGIEKGERLSDDDRARLLSLAKQSLSSLPER